MGCACARDAAAFAKSPDGGSGGAEDDMGWLSGGAAPSNARRVGPNRPTFKVQVELESGWVDCSAEETRQIHEKLDQDQLKFTIHARGQSYNIDFETGEGPTQTNTSTGKVRRLRILDEEDGDRPLTSASGQKLVMSDEMVTRQCEYGPQSKRGGASQHPFRVLGENLHARECFANLEKNEERLCGEWAVFYHSYSFAALIYEVQAAVGSVLFRFRSQYAPLPRLLVHEFNEIPDAISLVKRFNEDFSQNKRDHHPSFRRVAVSVMCSLASTGPEACVAMVFIAGYSCKDLSFRSVLENLLESCYVPSGKIKRLADEIIALAEKHGLDVSQFGGKPCQSGKAGHLMQIFIRRQLLDRLVYAAKPYGIVDAERMPVSTWMNSNSSFSVGQARIVAHPKYFMQANLVRMFVASADPTFHNNRRRFQEELVSKLSTILGEKRLRERAANGIYGGSLPAWWSAEDQRKLL